MHSQGGKQGPGGPREDAAAFDIEARVRSFGYAFAGIRALLRTQHNARIHGAASVVVVAAGFWLGLGVTEWCMVVLAMALVWSAEALNTALELLADALAPDHNPLVGRAKDMAAGGVLLAALGAAAVGVMVFLPRLLERLGSAGGGSF
ncbi:MAG: diacylglycerol kinase family protein [Deltaproteobacteria bacterium]|nr:diacylglycerol kinase family protein [Deltaproteobacteria bacterium]